MKAIDLTEQSVLCPYCNEQVSILIDHSVGSQQYIEDCEVCCKPITVNINTSGDNNFAVTVFQENEISI